MVILPVVLILDLHHLYLSFPELRQLCFLKAHVLMPVATIQAATGIGRKQANCLVCCPGARQKSRSGRRSINDW
jgi:hypothetical protein